MAKGGYRPGAGRKKGFAALEAERARARIAVKLAKELDPIVDKAIALAKKGDKAARDWLTDRAYGKPQQAIDVMTDGEAITSGVVILPGKNKAPPVALPPKAPKKDVKKETPAKPGDLASPAKTGTSPRK